jgi:biotin synthase-like enzyme
MPLLHNPQIDFGVGGIVGLGNKVEDERDYNRGISNMFLNLPT